MAKIQLKEVHPNIGLPGGTVVIQGKGFESWALKSENVHFSNAFPWLTAVSDTKIITKIPEVIQTGEIYIEQNGSSSNRIPFYIPELKVTDLYQVDNPQVDKENHVYTTLSGSRGDTMSPSIYFIDSHWEKHPYIQGMMNATSLIFNSQNELFVCSRYDGKIYRIYGENEYEVFSQGLGVAFGLAINKDDELYVGDRNGSVFKVDRSGQATFFASLPQSYIGYHLGFNHSYQLFATAPVHMGENFIYQIADDGSISIFFSGLSLFHGFCFDKKDNMYIAEGGRTESRILRITAKKEVDTILTGTDFIGVTFDRLENLLVSTRHSIYYIEKEKLIR